MAYRFLPVCLVLTASVFLPACERGAPESSPESTGKAGAVSSPDAAQTGKTDPVVAASGPGAESGITQVRFATFNCSLFRSRAGQLVSDLRGGNNPQARQIAAVIQQVRPDVLLLNEFDFDETGEAARIFREEYLARPSGNGEPVEFGYSFTAPVNTGVDSGVDLNRDGKLTLPEDAFGFGFHPGQYGMLVLSRYPVEPGDVRTFRNFLWKDLPGAALPVDPSGGEAWYPPEVMEKFRLSSKSHWDVPVRIGDRCVHFLVCHPTPPVFDGPEDRNGRRNHDEIRFWADYIGGESGHLCDDSGKKGGLGKGDWFVIAGDLNADPHDGDSFHSPARLLLENPLIQDPHPSSRGAVEASRQPGAAESGHRGPDAEDTGDFGEPKPGNLRIDYVLPCSALKAVGSGVFWPESGDPARDLAKASDHHMVWVDVQIPPR